MEIIKLIDCPIEGFTQSSKEGIEGHPHNKVVIVPIIKIFPSDRISIS